MDGALHFVSQSLSQVAGRLLSGVPWIKVLQFAGAEERHSFILGEGSRQPRGQLGATEIAGAEVLEVVMHVDAIDTQFDRFFEHGS